MQILGSSRDWTHYLMFTRQQHYHTTIVYEIEGFVFFFLLLPPPPPPPLLPPNALLFGRSLVQEAKFKCLSQQVYSCTHYWNNDSFHISPNILWPMNRVQRMEMHPLWWRYFSHHAESTQPHWWQQVRILDFSRGRPGIRTMTDAGGGAPH